MGQSSPRLQAGPGRASGGGSPCSQRRRQRWAHSPQGCVGDRQLRPVGKAEDTARSCGRGLEPEADKGAYSMSLSWPCTLRDGGTLLGSADSPGLHLWSAVCPFQAGFSCPLHTVYAAGPGSSLSLSSFGSTGRAFPFHSASQTSFRIPFLLQQPGE